MKRQVERGSFTIEAILTLSLFIFAFVTITSLATVAKIESTTQYAIDQTAKEISKYCYIADSANLLVNPPDGSEKKVDNVDEAIGAMANFANVASTAGTSGGKNTSEQLTERLKNMSGEDFESITTAAQDLYNSFGPVFDDPQGTITALLQVVADKAASAVISRVIAQPLCRSLVTKYITSNGDADETLEKMGVVDGLDGLDFRMSSFLMDNRTINVVVVYKIEVNGFRVFDQTITVKQTASTAAWLADTEGKKLSDIAEDSKWQQPDMERGKEFVAELQKDNPHQGVEGGIGVDLYDQDTNTFTSVHSINVFAATYSEYQKRSASDPASNYTLKKDTIKAVAKNYATTLQKNVNKIDENITMSDGTECMTAKDKVTPRKCEIILVIPSEAKDNRDSLATLNEIAEEIEAETGVRVNLTYRDNAL